MNKIPTITPLGIDINPNTTIEITNPYISNYNIPKIIQAEMVEIPPHFRTLKIRREHTFNHYSKIPYTRFYFTNMKITPGVFTKPLVFISNPSDSYELRHNFSNCTFIISGCICWGMDFPYEAPTKNELISYFWNTSFEHIPYQQWGSPNDFKILE